MQTTNIITSSQAVILVQFVSDLSRTFSGFIATYTTVLGMKSASFTPNLQPRKLGLGLGLGAAH